MCECKESVKWTSFFSPLQSFHSFSSCPLTRLSSLFLLSNLSALSNVPLLLFSLQRSPLPLLLSPLHFLELHQPVWLSVFHNYCVLLFTICLSFALCLWWKRIRCCVLGGVTLGRRINVMFRSKRIVHHPVPLPGCSGSFSSLRCPSLWVGPLASKKK